MTAQIPAAIRAVVLPAPDSLAQDTPTRRLLGGMGHDVFRAHSADHAIELLSRDHTDLLVVDITNDNSNRELIDSIRDLPESKRPEEMAIFTDAIDDSLRKWQQDVSPSRVHIFLKPLHMHGLLTVLRQIENRHAAGHA